MRVIRFGGVFYISNFGIQAQVTGGPEKKTKVYIWHFYYHQVCEFEPCNVKTSANDEKWWDCFWLVITLKKSASGEVEAKQNMADYIWNWKMSFTKSVCWTNIEGFLHNQGLKRVCGQIRIADVRKYKDR